MKLKLIALAVAGATMAPVAMAQTANRSRAVRYAEYRFRFGQGNQCGRHRCQRRCAQSRDAELLNFGFRGTEDLGGGLKFSSNLKWARSPLTPAAETWLAATAPSALQAAPVRSCLATGIRLTRQPRVGRRVLWNWYRQQRQRDERQFDPDSRAGATRNGFDRRVSNVVQWWSPAWNGFSARAAYGANEARTNSCRSRSVEPGFVGVLCHLYRAFTVAGAYEKHDQFANTATASTKDTGLKFVFTAVVRLPPRLA